MKTFKVAVTMSIKAKDYKQASSMVSSALLMQSIKKFKVRGSLNAMTESQKGMLQDSYSEERSYDLVMDLIENTTREEAEALKRRIDKMLGEQ